MRPILLLLIAPSFLFAEEPKKDLTKQPGYVAAEFLYESAPFAEAHASTIVETKSGLVAAWFGGTKEGKPDVCIWGTRKEKTGWTAPEKWADGIQADGKQLPCWNPVLFQPREGPLLLFYKIGPSPSTWWGLLRSSTDAGKTWSEARKLPNGILGPIKNKPVQLANGDILCPTSTENDGWRVHFERSTDLGKTWSATPPVNTKQEMSAIQPSILFLGERNLLAVGRTRQGRVFQIASEDAGATWGKMSLTELPNPNSGTDAVTLKDSRQLLVYNHSPLFRSPLNVAISKDGKNWQAAAILENEKGEYSYPAVIQTADGLVHAVYTWKRKTIKHVTLDPAKFELKE